MPYKKPERKPGDDSFCKLCGAPIEWDEDFCEDCSEGDEDDFDY